MIRLIESSSAQLRLQDARAFVERHAADGDVALLGASRGAVDDLARSIAATKGATIGIHRFSLTQLAARLAAPVLAAAPVAAALVAEAAVAFRSSLHRNHFRSIRTARRARPFSRLVKTSKAASPTRLGPKS